MTEEKVELQSEHSVIMVDVEIRRIRKLFEAHGEDAEDLISYAKRVRRLEDEVVSLRRAAQPPEPPKAAGERARLEEIARLIELQRTAAPDDESEHQRNCGLSEAAALVRDALNQPTVIALATPPAGGERDTLDAYYATTCPCLAAERYVPTCPKHGDAAAPQQAGPVAGEIAVVERLATHLRDRAAGFREAAERHQRRVGPLARAFDAAAAEIERNPEAFLSGGASPPRERVLTIAELGAIVAFARDDIDVWRWVLLMLSTAGRPEAASLFDPREQFDETYGLVDLHPKDWKRTKKTNPIVPAIEQMLPILRAWAASNAPSAKSRKTAWRTMRRALGFGPEVVAKTIRHSVATILRTRRVPGDEIETLLGHRVLKKTTAGYAKYDPDYLGNTRLALATLFGDVEAAADDWAAGHLRAKLGNRATVVLKRGSPEYLDYLAKFGKEGG